MRRLVANTVLGFQVAAFAAVCLLGSPMILFKFGVDEVRRRIESRWPNSDRVRAISFWIGLLAPFVMCVVLAAALGIAVVRVRALQQTSPDASPTPPG